MFRTVHYIVMHYIAFHYTVGIPLHYFALHCIALHCIALHCIALHCIALHCIALHCIRLHCIALCPTLISNDFKGPYNAQYNKQHCTPHVFEQYMHNHDDNYPARLGFEPGTSRWQMSRYEWAIVTGRHSGLRALHFATAVVCHTIKIPDSGLQKYHVPLLSTLKYRCCDNVSMGKALPPHVLHFTQV